MPKGIYYRSDEWKRNARERLSLSADKAREGIIAFNHSRKGIPFSKERKAQLVIAHKHTQDYRKGVPLSKELKEKISIATKKAMFNPLIRKKLSDAMKGKLKKRGKDCPAWKHGLTPIVQSIRQSSKYKQWRQDIFIKDNFTCQECGERGGYLEAHHIVSFKKLFSDAIHMLPLLGSFEAAMIYTPLWDLSNGKAMCKLCHNKTKKGRG